MASHSLQDHRLILFNGPRHSGKDTAAKYCQRALGAGHFKMSKPLKAGVQAIYGLTDEQVEYLESIKTQPSELLFGKSYVEAQISLSEDWAKKFHGRFVFGHLAARRLLQRKQDERLSRLVVCSDSGFSDEATPVIAEFGADNTLLVRIRRPGKAFTGDSRSYIRLHGVTSIDIENNGGVNEYHEQVHALATGWLEGTDFF
jgi:hypothetical protein